jgi:hypothetical protein
MSRYFLSLVPIEFLKRPEDYSTTHLRAADLERQPGHWALVRPSIQPIADQREAHDAAIPNSQIADSPYFYPHSWWRYCSGASWVSLIGNGCCRLGAELNVSVSSDVVPGATESSPRRAQQLLPQACAYRKSHLQPEAAGAYRLQVFGPPFAVSNGRAREIDAAIWANKGGLVLSGSENRQTCSRVGIVARTATLRLRVARSGDEVRQLAVWQPRLPVPEAARAGIPVCP